MGKTYFAFSRLETATVTVKNGKISEVFFSDDRPGGDIDMLQSLETLRNISCSAFAIPSIL